MSVFDDDNFYLNAIWMSFVIIIYKNFSLCSREMGSIMWLNQLIIDRSKDGNSEDWVELPGASAEIWSHSFQKEERLMLEGWEAFVSTSLALFQAEVWEQMDDINTLH